MLTAQLQIARSKHAVLPETNRRKSYRQSKSQGLRQALRELAGQELIKISQRLSAEILGLENSMKWLQTILKIRQHQYSSVQKMSRMRQQTAGQHQVKKKGTGPKEAAQKDMQAQADRV